MHNFFSLPHRASGGPTNEIDLARKKMEERKRQKEEEEKLKKIREEEERRRQVYAHARRAPTYTDALTHARTHALIHARTHARTHSDALMHTRTHARTRTMRAHIHANQSPHHRKCEPFDPLHYRLFQGTKLISCGLLLMFICYTPF